ncbi:MAG: ATP-dependent RecD-like DNA helicase [Oscillospiraceae bacterium]|nr:ATP-dependent RecD-like DNA helicase [Oscillospiraceae bacterium]
MLLAKFDYQLFPKRGQKSDSGYMVCVYKPVKKLLNRAGEVVDRFTAVGYNLPTAPTIAYELEGEWRKDPKRGIQFYVNTFKESVEPTREGIVSYLSSGQLKGIGPKMAEKIYETFGNETLIILDKNPQKLLEIKGINEKKLERIKDSYIENRGARDVVTILAPHGITAKRCLSLYKQYGEETVEIIRHHPYRLCEIAGIGFQICDKIAQSMGVNPNSVERVEAGMLYTLMENEMAGNTCMEKNEFLDKAKEVLRTTLQKGQLAWVAGQMVKDGKLESVGFHCYRPKFYKAEVQLGTIIGSMKNRHSDNCKNLDEEIEKQQKKMGVTFATEQANAVKMALTNVMSVITGGPGTGKTLITRAILDIYHRQFPKNEIKCCAPTGRAARRMTESTGYYATTIHSLLKIRANDDETEEDEEFGEKLECSLIVVDEVSMIDTFIALALLDAIPPTCKIVFVGDADQLPSVGAGAVLAEIISSGRIPVVKLDTVFRQADTSRVAINAQKMRHGDTHLEYGDDFHLIKSADLEASATILVETYLQEVDKYGLDNVALLSPFRKKTVTGVDQLNLALRERVNPADPAKAETSHNKKLYRVGDKIMQTKNNDYASNGDLGYITDIKTLNGETSVFIDFGDNRKVEYDSSELDNIDLGYATTIHKSQGSEYKSVIISLQNAHFIMLNRPLIYTAITRSKDNCIIVGDTKALAISIKKTEVDRRCTNLALFINNQVA